MGAGFFLTTFTYYVSSPRLEMFCFCYSVAIFVGVYSLFFLFAFVFLLRVRTLDTAILNLPIFYPYTHAFRYMTVVPGTA